jgi:hypothetical protein
LATFHNGGGLRRLARRLTGSVWMGLQVKDMIKSKEGRNQLWLICLLTTGLVVVTSLIFLL